MADRYQRTTIYAEGTDQNDILNGANGHDVLYGNAGDDRIRGYKGDDEIEGGRGDDVIIGNKGEDWLIGDAGNDRLDGGNGDDVLNGGKGNDVLDGGTGLDMAVLDYAGSTAGLTLNADPDRFWRFDVETGTWLSGTGDDFTYLRFWADVDGDGVLSTGDELDYVSSVEAFHIRSGSGHDHLTGGKGNDILDAGQGNDIIDGGDGVDTAHFNYENAQNDILLNPEGAIFYKPASDGWRYDEDSASWVSGTADDFTYHRIWSDVNGNGLVDAGDEVDYFTSVEKLILQAGDGNDVISGNNYADILKGGNGADDLFGQGGDDHLEGGRGQDILVGGDGDDLLYGGKGHDSLYGDAGRDHLDGGDGNDLLFDGDGSDIMTGGAGADKFHLWLNISNTPFDLERNIITDFNSAEGDRLVFDTAAGTETSLAGLGLQIRGGPDDVAWITNYVGNHIYAELSGVDYRDIIAEPFEAYFEVI